RPPGPARAALPRRSVPVLADRRRQSRPGARGHPRSGRPDRDPDQELMEPQSLAYLDVWIDGVPMGDAVGKIRRLSVDERADDVSSFHMPLDMAPAGGDWTQLADGRFGLLHRVTIGFGLGPPDQSAPSVKDIVFDGYITAVEPVFGVDRTSDSSLELFGLDAGCLMHLEERQRRFQAPRGPPLVHQNYPPHRLPAHGDRSHAPPPRPPPPPG